MGKFYIDFLLVLVSFLPQVEEERAKRLVIADTLRGHDR